MKKFFTLIAVAAMAFAVNAATLTICDEVNYNAHVPVYGLYADTEGTISQMIYPADMLTDMVGAEISKLTFYPETSIKFENATLELSLKVVEETEFGEAVAIPGTTVVGTAQPNYGDTELVFEFDEPFVYEGGNLLVQTYVTVPGSWATTYFLGINVDYNASFCAYMTTWSTTPSTYLEKFLPKATLEYEINETPVDPPVEPTYEGYWIVLIDKNGNEIPYQLNPGVNTDYSTTVALEYNIYGDFDIDNGEERPVVGYYFIVDDVKYGAPENMTETVLGTALDNPLVEGENYYTVPVGYNYTLGVFVDGETGELYVYAAQGGYTGIDELVNGKTVASQRFFNMAGQEMKEANGVTIVVTTYTDGTTSAVKVIK